MRLDKLKSLAEKLARHDVLTPSLSADVRALADVVLDSLEADEAAAVDRAKSIDAEWLQLLGFRSFAGFADRVMVEVLPGGYLAWGEMCGCRLCDLHTGITTRGELLDIIHALKGGA